MEKTLQLNGRIDSTNAAAIEQELTAALGDFQGTVLLDAEALDYISSAGLRVILRLKKANADTRIINCNTEVYEIFDMTGFTEMMKVSKAYRRLSIEGCEVIGEGANGKVYRTDPDTIVKVYKNPDSLDEIHNERELARKAFVMGIPTAIPYDVVKVGDLYGSVFELLDAKSFAQLIREGGDTKSLAAKSVEILKTIHSTMLKSGELPSKREEAIGWAKESAAYLPEEIGTKLIALFEAIPETNNMLHGDYHIKNIMQQNGENLLIDMDTLSMGHPIFEFAAIFAAYRGFSCVDKNNSCKFLGIPREQCDLFLDTTIQQYFAGDSEQALAEKIRMMEIICYTRILRRQMKRLNRGDASQKPVIDFCHDFLIEAVPKAEKLYYEIEE